jgi:hypothetical protein
LTAGDEPAPITAEGATGCTIVLSPAGGVAEIGQTVTCTAVPEPGHRFLYWQGDLLGETANPATVVAYGDMTIKAVFADAAEPLYAIALDVEGDGSVRMVPPGNAYPIGTQVALVAEPDPDAPGTHFVGYEGDAESAEPITLVNVTQDTRVRAVFGEAHELNATSSVGLLMAIALTMLAACRMLRNNRTDHTRM